MNRVRLGVACLLVVAGVARIGTPRADSAPAYVRGKQYLLVSTPAAPPDAEKVTVQEFFSYGCPHCFAFDSTLETWISGKPSTVVFERVPAGLGRPEWDNLSRAFYIAQTLGVADKIHKALFEGIHEQSLPLFTMPNLRLFFGDVAAVSPEAFDIASTSFEVDHQMRRAADLARTDGILSVPTIIIDGKYVTDYVKAGSFAETPKVIDYLIARSRKERAI